MQKYEVYKVLNNNVIISRDDSGKEIILKGKGIGFKKNTNDIIFKEHIESIFTTNDQSVYKKLYHTMKTVPIEYVDIVEEIVGRVEKSLNVKLNYQIYVLLTDHLMFAIERSKKKIFLQLPLQAEIKLCYQTEYNIALEVLKLIESRMGVLLPNSEAAFIALHIINATSNNANMDDAVDIVVIVNDILKIIEKYYSKKLDYDSFDYSRLVTHLNYFARRIVSEKKLKQDEDLIELILKKYKKANRCVQAIKEQLYNKFNYNMCNQEFLYLVLHIQRNME